MRALTWMLAAWMALCPSLALATQYELVPPTSGIYTGVQFSQKIGDAFRSLASCNKGAVAPANVAASAVDGLCWIDDSVTPWVVKRYVNGGWATEAALDPTDSSYAGVVGGGIGSVNSASTTNLASVPQANVNILGTTTIAGFGSAAPTGVVKFLTFAAALTLTYSSALPTPCGVSLVTAANDTAVVTHLGSGNWKFFSYQRANGTPVDCGAVARMELGDFDTIPPGYVAAYGQALTRTSYPAYLAKVTRSQNGTRTASNATITGLTNTKGLGAGMPIEGTGLTNCVISSVTSTTIVVTSAGCVGSSGTSTVTAFLTGYGTGGSTSTVGARDCRGRNLAGRDRDDPGSFANRLTASYFGADSSIFGVSGSSSESVTMQSGNLIQHLHAVYLNDPGHTHLSGPSGAQIAISSGSLDYNMGPGSRFLSNLASMSTGSASTGMTVRDTAGGAGTANQTANTGSASPTPMRTVPPMLVVECIVRVTP